MPITAAACRRARKKASGSCRPGWAGSASSAPSVVDGGNPVGKSTTVKNGSVIGDGGANPVSGYSIIEASSTDDAVAKAKGCPIIAAGGSVEIAEIFPM